MQTKYDFNQISADAKSAIATAFKGSAVSVEEGWHGRVHMKVVSEAFNGQTEKQKQKAVWDVLRKKLKAEATGISLVLVYGLDEI